MREMRRLLERIDQGAPRTLEEHRAQGGLAALELARSHPREAIAEITAAGLSGRGGAGFPTGRKWEAVADAAGDRLVVMNGDESEVGTFKDRVLMEEDPFLVLEGLLATAHAVGAREAHLYIRGEYQRAWDRMQAAAEAMASVAGIPLHFWRGHGAYVCGEESALFRSIEGYRGEPQQKPPFPTERGLFGLPTVVQNVETLACVSLILRHGASWYREAGTEDAPGTKLFPVIGHVVRPGLYEFPFGVTLREILEAAGGPTEPLRWILLGGASGTLLAPSAWDVPLTSRSLAPLGAALGAGTVVAIGASVPREQVLLSIARFFARESCGQCLPCRMGTDRQARILERRAREGPRPGDLELLRDIGAAMAEASICGLGQTAAQAVLSGVGEEGMADDGTAD